LSRKPKESPIHCQHFNWRLFRRDGVYYADGRGGRYDLAKNSLGTRDRLEALENLRQLDHQKAVERGLVAQEPIKSSESISIAQGWVLYMEDRGRPLVLRGVGKNSLERYRAVRDKHVEYCEELQLKMWSQVDRDAVLQYGSWLHKECYAPATVILELNTVASVIKLLVEKNRLRQTAESQWASQKSRSRIGTVIAMRKSQPWSRIVAKTRRSRGWGT